MHLFTEMNKDIHIYTPSCNHEKEKYTVNRIVTETFVNNLEWYYTQYSVYRSLVVCNSDEEVVEYAQMLTKMNHSIRTIQMHDLEDERRGYIEILKLYTKESYRMLIVSYDVLIRASDLIEAFVLPEQNLVVLGKLYESQTNYIVNWLDDAKGRGFITRIDCKVLSTMDEVLEQDEQDTMCYDQNLNPSPYSIHRMTMISI